MAYIINRFNGTELTVLEDGTIDTTTSLGLVGRNYVGYGETQNENYVFLLENFANDAPPSRPILGQLWYDSANNVLTSYNGTIWLPVGHAIKSADEPVSVAVGQLWLKDNEEKQLFVYDGTTWQLIGPEAVTGFGTTRAVSLLWRDITGSGRPVIALTVDGNIQSIVSHNDFQWRFSDQTLDNPVNDTTLRSMFKGINMIPGSIVVGTLSGNATTASRLETGRTINGVFFDGTTNIALKASTTNRLVSGTYLTGNSFDGSTEQTWSVNATSNNMPDTIVARNNAGNFAAGTITANLAGNVNTSIGISTFNDVDAVEVRATRFVGATLSGNAFSATQLATTRTINTVPFNGTANIVVPAAAGTLTGSFINGTVLDSNLRSVGTLNNLVVSPTGIRVGTNLQLREDSNDPVIESTTDKFTLGVNSSLLNFWSAAFSANQGWEAVPTISPVGTWNLGNNPNKFNKIYANEFKGNADSATVSTSSTNLTGGGAGSIPFQLSAGTTTMLPIGTTGQVLRVGGSNSLVWQNLSSEPLTSGTHILLRNLGNTTVSEYNGNSNLVISVDATSVNTVSKIVARDSNGNFSAGTISANVIGNTNGIHTGNVVGNVSGNAGTATRLQTPRTINGVAFDGTDNITIEANDPNSGAPVGSILYYPTSVIPVGWLMCNGASISKTIYPLLFSKLGYLYGGSGDLFGLPDLRGEFIRGWDSGRGVDAFRALGSAQAATEIATTVFQAAFNAFTNADALRAGNTISRAGEAGYATPQNFVSTRPRNIALVACIKAFGEIDEPEQILAANVLTTINSISVGGLGVNQTWQNVTGSRVGGTTYTNSTGNPIMVNIVRGQRGYVNSISLTVGGVNVARSVTASDSGSTMSAIVPNGATYVLSANDFDVWVELR